MWRWLLVVVILLALAGSGAAAPVSVSNVTIAADPYDGAGYAVELTAEAGRYHVSTELRYAPYDSLLKSHSRTVEFEEGESTTVSSVNDTVMYRGDGVYVALVNVSAVDRFVVNGSGRYVDVGEVLLSRRIEQQVTDNQTARIDVDVTRADTTVNATMTGEIPVYHTRPNVLVEYALNGEQEWEEEIMLNRDAETFNVTETFVINDSIGNHTMTFHLREGWAAQASDEWRYEAEQPGLVERILQFLMSLV